MKKIFDQDMKQETASEGPAPIVRISMTRVLQPAYTRRLRPDPEEAVFDEPVKNITGSSNLTWYGITDTGMVRPHNEDSFSCLEFGKWSLFVVADGMGGHDAGEVASRVAVETVCREIEKHTTLEKDPLLLIEQVVQKANGEVRFEGLSRGSNMGTTLSLALVIGTTAYIANVGDSRVYWIENGAIKQITKDHSLVAKLVEAGKLTKEEARNHPKSNLLFRTIGNEEEIRVDTFQKELKKGGNLVLCTDGLWGEVSDEDIHRIIRSQCNAQKTGEELVRLANTQGGKDNVTVVVARVV